MRRTREAAAKTRQVLIDSALQLFLQKGYSNVSLHEIAGHRGVTRGAFYWHFKSKEEMLYAICERERAFIENLMVDLFMTKGLEPDKHLGLVLTGVIKNYFGNKRFRDYIELTWFKMEHHDDDRVNHLKKIANEYFADECRKIIARGIKESVFNDAFSPRDRALHLTATVNGIYRLYFISPEQMTRTHALVMVKQLLDALRKQP